MLDEQKLAYGKNGSQYLSSNLEIKVVAAVVLVMDNGCYSQFYLH
jgi:hypothetical protein